MFRFLYCLSNLTNKSFMVFFHIVEPVVRFMVRLKSLKSNLHTTSKNSKKHKERCLRHSWVVNTVRRCFKRQENALLPLLAPTNCRHVASAAEPVMLTALNISRRRRMMGRQRLINSDRSLRVWE